MYFYFWFKSFLIGLRICGILITLRRQILASDLFPPFELGLIKICIKTVKDRLYEEEEK